MSSFDAPGGENAPDKQSSPPSWIPAWMGERERAGLILAAGIILAACVMICGGCCSGLVQTWILRAG